MYRNTSLYFWINDKMLQNSMVNSSMSIWPCNKSLADDIGVPIVLEYRPYDSDNMFSDLLTTNLPKCSYCSAFITSAFSIDRDKHVQCPFCGNDFQLPNSYDITYHNFKIDQKIDDFSLYLCFVIDLDCSEEYSQVLKVYFSVALKALLPDMEFMVAFIRKNRFHFVKLFNDIPKIFSFDPSISLFETLEINSLLNNVKNISLIEDLFFCDLHPNSQNNSQLHEIIDFSNLFSSCPDNTFIKFIMFSPNHVSNKCASLLSFDWISPIEKNNCQNIDGFYLNPKDIDNIEIQIQTMIQRYKTSTYAVNVSTQSFIPKQFEISPMVCTKPSYRNGSSIIFTISFPRLFSTFKEIHIQFVSNYIFILPDGIAKRRTQVNSLKFFTSKDILPILRTVDTSVVWRNLNSRNEEKEFIKKLLEIYKSKIIDGMPGTTKQFDPFFTLLPNLQWFLKFYLTNTKPINSKFVIENERKMVRFCQCVSFWENQENKIEEMSISYADSNKLLKSPPIVIVDNCTIIDLFMDDQIIKNSRLDREIERRILRRFPVPTVRIMPRETLFLRWPYKDNYDHIRETFDPTYKKM
ncbi:hypothetical protein TRFO_26648 [Tritrichomonas foetus]|uniref:Zinc finger Sec23/Sec24-type domain-containing protein n=1 Tax=Tritrichomonas foetus TaxID=1144522 RepID=A0A1J4K411_9EUKA|nr:hypothetical protein TRFO_26648 [Tritrichomonas foetus]|eukprot:OHT05576.1 hypothetical protein TRFO_26648 [Tritrichomonas foetus]